MEVWCASLRMETLEDLVGLDIEMNDVNGNDAE